MGPNSGLNLNKQGRAKLLNLPAISETVLKRISAQDFYEERQSTFKNTSNEKLLTIIMINELK